MISLDPYDYKRVDYVSDGVQECMIKYLRWNTEYGITVQAFNNNGRGPAAGEVVIKTSGGDLPDPPLYLKVQEVWSRSANIAWSPSHTGSSPNTKYLVKFWRFTVYGDIFPGLNLVNSSQTSVLIKNLDPASNYYLNIRAENEVGRSEPSETIYFTTNEEEPSAPPRRVKAEVKMLTSVFVTWKPPLKSEWNGKLTGFYVGYKSLQDSSQLYTFKTVDYNKRGEYQEYLITNLRKGMQYSIIVKAFNNVGIGPPSKPVIVKIG
ncbi:protein sidekick-1-like [Argiope bruennichi]|uniref:protein sidekick-1-like n=1 Tax=Argiope bruennichi TaxID=94029 RepID=UPI002493D127|nr:protein sidekick-1-like [Argiope bruennichi]